MVNDERTRIAFSTLACPQWSLEQAADAAARYGYDGLELRLLDGQILHPGISRATRDRVAEAITAAGVELPVIDTSVKLTADGAQVDDDLRAWCDIAADWGASMIRVFGGTPPRGVDWSDATRRATERLARVAPHAETVGVRVLMETHDAFTVVAAICAVLDEVPSPAVGVLWDINHPHRSGESPERVWEILGDRIGHVHIKDTENGAAHGDTQVLLGDGDVPVRRILRLLAENAYDGWLSVEWEKKWYPEIAEPDVALPQHIGRLRGWLGEQ